jgi:2-oxoglutarate ferredoxin oxidoreductase subunit gamma
MTKKIIIAGSGGQGIMLLGKILAEAAMREDKFVTWLPSYGAEVRGGTAHCMVIISDQEISSPYIETADILISLNAPSLEKFKARLTNKGLVFLNSSLSPGTAAGKLHIEAHPFTDRAIALGNIRVANMVALGNFVNNTGIVTKDTVKQVVADIAPPDKKHLIEINQKALEEGARL